MNSRRLLSSVVRRLPFIQQRQQRPIGRLMVSVPNHSSHYNGWWSRMGRLLFAVGGGGTSLAIGGWFTAPKEADKPDAVVAGRKKFGASLADDQLIRDADELYDAFLIENMYKLLNRHTDSTNADVLWRLARAACEMAKRVGISKDERKQFMYEAYAYIQKAIDFEPAHGNFAVHKWYAILLDYIGEYEGTKVRLQNSPKVRDHFEKAHQLNPADPTTVHLLGLWYYTFADLPSYQRRLASWIFAEPPTATYDEALELFLKAEAIHPNFYSKNLLYIGKIYAKTGRITEAKVYLERAARMPVVSPDDLESHMEAQKLFESM